MQAAGVPHTPQLPPYPTRANSREKELQLGRGEAHVGASEPAPKARLRYHRYLRYLRYLHYLKRFPCTLPRKKKRDITARGRNPPPEWRCCESLKSDVGAPICPPEPAINGIFGELRRVDLGHDNRGLSVAQFNPNNACT